tara:strand:- start:752 stop:970 length:219 start_codon:yes stop_codon:yes gene_type:complete
VDGRIMKKIIGFVAFSGIWITLILNPLHWRLTLMPLKKNTLNPKFYEYNLQMLCLGIHIVIDDGDWEESIIK